MSLLFFLTATTTDNNVAAVALMCCYFFVPANGINGFATCIDIGKSKAGTVAGIINFAGNMGAFFLSILFGKIVDVTHNFNTPLFFVAGFLLTGALAWMWVDPSKQVVLQIHKEDLLVL